MSSVQIVRVPIMPLGMINAHLIIGSTGKAILVDAGLPGTENKIHAALSRNGLSFTDIKLVVLTHAHVDHAGNAARIKRLTRAPVMAHEGDLPYYLQEVPMQYCPTNRLGKVLLSSGLLSSEYEKFKPDILLRDNQQMRLDEWGVDGEVRHTPGHTTGSISIELADHNWLVGDLIASGVLLGGIVRTSRPLRLVFEDDPELVQEQLKKILRLQGKQLHLGHGGPLSANQLQGYLNSLGKKAVDSLPTGFNTPRNS